MGDRHADDDRDDGGAATPIAEYQLAGSPRRVFTPPSATSSSSPSLFSLKSPFSTRNTKAASDEETKDKAEREDRGLLGDMFTEQYVDEVVDSPTHHAAQQALQEITEEDDAAVKAEQQSDHGSDKKAQANGDDEEYRYVYLNNREANDRFGYCVNLVITSRFTIYNFIPKLLFYEFSKLANAYFLLISIMQTIKPISNTGGFPASLPALSIIVLIDMFFACLEDYKRHKADHIANELPCLLFSMETKQFEKAKWHELHVGDIVKIHNREAVPADLVILAACEPDVSNPAGICYVETKSLDGETNLKLRQGLEATYTTLLSDEAIADLAGVVVCEKPNNSIHRFNGTLSMANGKKEAISTNAILLRGSTLRNTDYIYGLVVNTGPDTKIMMASSTAPMKWSNMEKRLNQQITYICMLMVVLCLAGAAISIIWNAKNLSKRPTRGAWYLYDRHAIAVRLPVGNFFIQVLYYFLLLNSFIPVSLYVSMTSVKFMQAYFMNNDIEMYHTESDTPCQVRTMSLNEELGQIDYIFSDKTGTLTCNIMEFRKCSINGISYGHGQTEVGIAAQKRRMGESGDMPGFDNQPTIMEERDDEDDSDLSHRHRVVKAPFVNYQDDSIFEALARNDKNAATISSFFEHLAVCHTVMPERASDGSVRLSASSPDEQALVAAAACFGYKFSARAPGKAFVEYFSCLESHEPPTSSTTDKGDYHILEVLEFNSTRKRMSVIMRGPQGELKLLCKGADTVMYERLRATTDPHVLHVRNQTLQHMENFASEGLRTLVIGTADIDPVFYESWVQRYRIAINDMRQIEQRRLGEPNDIDRCMEEIEVNMEVLGATAIEDRLQSEVPDTIHRLRQASIKIWMLTGDKEETAINIGFACRLLTPDVERIVISADTHPDLVSIMEELQLYANHPGGDPAMAMTRGKGSKNNCSSTAASNGDGSGSEGSEDTHPLTRIESMAQMTRNQEGLGLALVIDGETLELALEECPLLLLSIALKCVAVIACRVSPAQKAQLVRLVRDNNPEVRTLAIGDGANDVSMIQAAHVGIGISGQEGMQAANSSDYAIAQFRFLSRLLLVHGRWNYVRMGKLILYIFYKNVMMNLTQYWYMIFTGFSGQKFFLEWGLQGYNLLFTALPIVLISTFEQDVPAFYAHNYPVLYRVGQENSRFNTKVVWAWITSCVWESLVISFGTIFGMRYLVDTGETPNMWVYGCTAFTVVLFVVTLKLCLHQQMWWPLIHIPIYIVSYGLWIATAAFISYGKSVSSAYWNGVFTHVFYTKVFWLLVPLLVFSALSRDFLWKGYTRAFQPSYKHLAQEVDAFGLKHMADYLLSFPPPESIPRDAEAAYKPAAPSTTPKKIKKDEMASKAAAAATPVATVPRLHHKGSLVNMSSRKSITRGSAFSYDAESVMVESFMATERYNNDAHEARPLFDRHASRGSMAFHTFMGDTGGGFHASMVGSALAASERRSEASPMPTAAAGTEEPRVRRAPERQQSAGNVFRGARHSFGRRRFFSVSTAGSTPTLMSGGDRSSLDRPSLERNSSNRSLRRNERALSSDASANAGNANANALPSPMPTTGFENRQNSVGPRMVRRHASLGPDRNPRKMSA